MAEKKIFLNSIDESGHKKYIACMMYAGVCSYPEDPKWSKVLINTHIDEIAKTFIGAPVVIGHNQPTDAHDPIIVGKVEKVFCNSEGFTVKDGTFVPADGKYYCEFSVFKNEGFEACEKFSYVSTSYVAEEVILPAVDNGERESFQYLGISYDVEVRKILARHLAIVGNPRYEDAIIYENAKKENMTKENESKIELESGVFLSFVSSAAEKGKEVLAAIFSNAKKKDNEWDEKDEEKEKDNESDEDDKKEDKKDNKKKKNNKKKDNEVEDEEMDNESDEDDKKEDKKDNSKDEPKLFEIDGEKVSLETLQASYKAAKAIENAKKEKPEEKRKSAKEIEAETFNNSREKAPQYMIGAASLGKGFFNK